VPTVRFQVPYVFLVLAHDRRRILHFGVTAHATAEWTAQQLREAFPWDSAPGYLLRDRGSAPTARSMDLCATPPFAQSSQVLSIADSIDMLPPLVSHLWFFCTHNRKKRVLSDQVFANRQEFQKRHEHNNSLTVSS